MDDFFDIISHEVPCQHLREHSHTAIDDTRPLRLAVKQYVPKSNKRPSPGDVTFILSPAAGILKEAYEPFCHDLAVDLAHYGVRVRAFWIADSTQLGQSAVLNRGNLGHDFSWHDHSRDLLQVVQTFRDQMTRPLIGLGHSLGACQMIWLAMIHPGLFETLLLIDPNVLKVDTDLETAQLARRLYRRREVWPSAHEATTALTANPFYKSWDPRVVRKLAENSFVDVTQSSSADVQLDLKLGKVRPGMVATKSPRLAEFNTFFAARRDEEYLDKGRQLDGKYYELGLASPVKEIMPWYPLYPLLSAVYLRHLACNVMFIVGEESGYSQPWILENRMATTGTGLGGSGGAAKGKVEQYVVRGGGHYDIFDLARSKEVVQAAATHLVNLHGQFMQRLNKRKEWQASDSREQQAIDKVFARVLETWNSKTGPGFNEVVRKMTKL